jgi:hypothetical protein
MPSPTMNNILSIWIPLAAWFRGGDKLLIRSISDIGQTSVSSFSPLAALVSRQEPDGAKV